MPIINIWDDMTRDYERMYEQMKGAPNEHGRNFANHAEGMLRPIPQIRDLPEFENVDLDMSMGRLKCKAKSGSAWLSLGCSHGFIYMETYEKATRHSEMKKYSSEQIVPALQAELKQFTPD